MPETTPAVSPEATNSPINEECQAHNRTRAENPCRDGIQAAPEARECLIPDDVGRFVELTRDLKDPEIVRKVWKPVTIEDLHEFSEAFSELKDPEFLKRAWRLAESSVSR
jgi:hypothetical protein